MHFANVKLKREERERKGRKWKREWV